MSEEKKIDQSPKEGVVKEIKEVKEEPLTAIEKEWFQTFLNQYRAATKYIRSNMGGLSASDKVALIDMLPMVVATRLLYKNPLLLGEEDMTSLTPEEQEKRGRGRPPKKN